MKPLGRTVVTALAAVVIVSVGARVRAADTERPAPPGSNLSFTKFYTGPVGRQGKFPGKLLCLCCDLMPNKDAAKPCDVNGHHNVLLLDDGLHPLIAGTEEVTKQINSNELHDKQVIVSGNYYPATGIIFVDKIQLQ
jgi:hypothetical protein